MVTIAPIGKESEQMDDMIPIACAMQSAVCGLRKEKDMMSGSHPAAGLRQSVVKRITPVHRKNLAGDEWNLWRERQVVRYSNPCDFDIQTPTVTQGELPERPHSSGPDQHVDQ